tara:strand:- start:55 stop:924 length:870 start_codon:yes stop_codon:yes gene_type:complete
MADIPQYNSCKITKAVGRPSFDRQGGISKLYLFAYVKYSRSLNTVQDQQVITFPATVVYEFEAENMSFSQSTSLKDGGVAWNQKLSFTLTQSDKDSEVYKLANKDYSAIILDRNGDYRFIGMRNGGEVTVQTTTGTGKGEMNGYSVTLTASESNQAYYVPTFDSLFTVVKPIAFECPSRPINLTYRNYTGGDSITLDWTAAPQGTLAVFGYYSYINNSYHSTINFGTNLSITGLAPNTDFAMFVKAYDTDGNIGGPSNIINVTSVGDGAYELRVANDFGYTESLECITV